jgi:hypothetical protein
MLGACVRWIPPACALLALCPATTGCFRRGPELAPVAGTVTLDGEPLANAQVQFQPTSHGPYSVATTNSLGQYVLEYTKDRPGAALGTHVVRITTQTTTVDESGVEIQVPQRVPARYNDRSELLREVKPGENEFNFALTSEPAPEEARGGRARPRKAGSRAAQAGGRAAQAGPSQPRPAARPDGCNRPLKATVGRIEN